MQEAFLHYVWQFQLFSSPLLQTTDGQEIIIHKKGFLTGNGGPDFQEARLQIGEVAWAGHVEMHLKASDWLAHNHHHDRAYDNVILHVVWEADTPIARTDGTLLPVLELKHLVSPELVARQAALLAAKTFVPCEKQLPQVSELSKMNMLDRTLLQRLEQKALGVKALFDAASADLEEVAYQLMAQNFGFKLNAEPMLRLAQNLPLKIIQKHRNSPLQVEALLFGQAGWLANAKGSYAEQLQSEYDFLAKKYQLHATQLAAHEWKLLRTRPANFPTIRLAQLASLLVQQPSLFSLFTQTTDFQQLKNKLQVKQSVYWQQHYLFDKPAARPLYSLGSASVDTLLVNTAIPLLVFYANYSGNTALQDRAIRFLEQLPAEKNHITEQWQQHGLSIKNSADSQASLELYRQYCQQKKCLSCKIGTEILRS